MKTCLITGSTGFIGSHVTRLLVRSGWRVHSLKRSTSSCDGLKDAAASITFHDLETTSLDDLFSATPFDAVIHVATNYGRGNELPSRLATDNTIFPLTLLERSLAKKVPVFLNTDTCFTTDYKYLRPYTLSKKQFVQWGKILSEGTETQFVNFVLQHPYGPGDRGTKFVPAMAKQCLESTGTIDLTPGDQRKDFIYVGDVAEAYQLVLDKRDQMPAGFTQFEVGSGKAVSIRHFVELLHRLSHSKAKLNFGGLKYRDAEIMFSQADSSALQALGWRPIVSLEEGILRLLREDFAHKTSA
ncbi:MAG: NAD-dependent epimerase/dehydratase [Gemmataceae bacterium]